MAPAPISALWNDPRSHAQDATATATSIVTSHQDRNNGLENRTPSFTTTSFPSSTTKIAIAHESTRSRASTKSVLRPFVTKTPHFVSTPRVSEQCHTVFFQHRGYKILDGSSFCALPGYLQPIMAQTKQVGRRAGPNTPRQSKAPRGAPSPRARATGGKRPPGVGIALGGSGRKAGGRPQRAFHCILLADFTNTTQLETQYHLDDHIAISPAQSRYVKYVDISIPQICSCCDFPSLDLSEKSPSHYCHGMSPTNLDSRARLFRHYRKPPKRSLYISSRTPIFAPSMRSASLSCRRIFS